MDQGVSVPPVLATSFTTPQASKSEHENSTRAPSGGGPNAHSSSDAPRPRAASVESESSSHSLVIETASRSPSTEKAQMPLVCNRIQSSSSDTCTRKTLCMLNLSDKGFGASTI
jgi:hypothetical protein